MTHEVLELCERPMETTLSFCPFCRTFDEKGFNPRQLEKHLARHLESLALFALPRNNDKT